jgi:hypothetical protein
LKYKLKLFIIGENMLNFKIELDPREDKEQQIYYLAKKSAPILLDCRKGVAFLLFVSEDGNEELQIANLDNDTGHYTSFSRKDDRIKIKLDKREDSYNKTFYVAKLRANFTIDCSDVSFLAFLSKEGREELQIVGKFSDSKPEKIIRKRKIVPAVVSDEPIKFTSHDGFSLDEE